MGAAPLGRVLRVRGHLSGHPLRAYELAAKVTALRLTAFGINVALVIYLVLSKRLLGVRGGKAAYQARLRSESIMQAAIDAAGSGAGRRGGWHRRGRRWRGRRWRGRGRAVPGGRRQPDAPAATPAPAVSEAGQASSPQR